MRIGLTPRDFMGWQGGRELFQLFAAGLQAGAEPQDVVEIATSIGDGGVGRQLLRRARKVARRLLGRPAAGNAWGPGDLATIGFPVRNGAGHWDVVGPFGVAPNGLVSPWVGYVPDLQHRRLPDMFSARERAARDRNVNALLRRADVLLVNAHDVARDLRQLYPPSRGTIVALPFAPCAERSWFAEDGTILSRHGIETPFFLCSNQFWKHKNHRLVIEAVRLAREEGAPLRFVFTGETRDYRHPDHFAALLREIDRAGIAGDVKILGLIPKPDQIQLMRRAVAIVQPSLFEGGPGGGAVYNAIALGRPVILSDLPVNREIEAGLTRFFDPHDAGDLLAKLRLAANAGPVAEDAAALLRESDARLLAFGQALRGAFAKAVR